MTTETPRCKPGRFSTPPRSALWEQVDEKTGKPESWFNIVEKDGVYVGTIVKMFQKPAIPRSVSGSCTIMLLRCEGPSRPALIKGMTRRGTEH